jgi:hypothetical protein
MGLDSSVSKLAGCGLKDRSLILGKGWGSCLRHLVGPTCESNPVSSPTMVGGGGPLLLYVSKVTGM